MTNGTYASKLSLINYYVGGFYEGEISLRSAKIDGVYYGDSTLLSVSTQLDNKAIFLDYVLYQNYPNPFNPSTQILFYTPSKGYVSLKVYDILGRRIAVLADGIMEAAHHMIIFDGSNCSSGTYFYCLQAGISIETKKLSLLK